MVDGRFCPEGVGKVGGCDGDGGVAIPALLYVGCSGMLCVSGVNLCCLMLHLCCGCCNTTLTLYINCRCCIVVIVYVVGRHVGVVGAVCVTLTRYKYCMCGGKVLQVLLE